MILQSKKKKTLSLYFVVTGYLTEVRYFVP